jgi:hypothetical protein
MTRMIVILSVLALASCGDGEPSGGAGGTKHPVSRHHHLGHRLVDPLGSHMNSRLGA